MTIADKLTLLEQTKEAQRVKLGLPKNLPFNQYVKFIRDPFTITELFKNGEQGAWFDPSDLSTLYQNVSGATPVTKDSDPAGLILDGSKNGETKIINYYDFSDSNTVEQFVVENDPGINAYPNADNTGLAIKAKGGNYYLSLDIPLTPLEKNKTYKATIRTLTEHNSTHTLLLYFYNQVGGKNRGGTPNRRMAPGEYTLYLDTGKLFKDGVSEGQIGSISLKIGTGTIEGYVEVASLKLEEVAGNHATQPTASARPIYRTDGKLHWLEFDEVDDTLSTKLPSGTYTEIKASRDGVTHKYPVNVNGTYTIGDLTQTKQSVSGLVLVNRQLTPAEIVNVTNLMKVKAGLPL